MIDILFVIYEKNQPKKENSMGNTMKKEHKASSTAKFAEAVSEILDLIERNAHKDDAKQTSIEIKIKGDSEEVLELDIENLNEVIKILKLNKED